MHRIDGAGAVDGLFTEGSPATGQEATVLTADWLNEVQENLVDLITFAGIALVKGDYTQVRDAVVALVAGVVGTGGGSVPTTRQVNGGGLVTGGGALAADLTLSVIAATIGEVAAQVATDKAVTPASLAGLISISVAGSSMIITLGTAIIQIFKTTVSANSTLNAPLPTAFPNACMGAWVNGGKVGDYGVSHNGPFASGEGTTIVSIQNAIDDPVSVTVLAIGR
jgi:hypothetical protein